MLMAKRLNDLSYAPIHRLAPAIAGGELRSVELVKTCLSRIRNWDPKLHAMADVYWEEAMTAARLRDEEVDAGKLRGPLHGIPVAFKDLCEIEGKVTTCGSLMWRDRISPMTADVVQRLLACGMVAIGKTHMVEFAFGGWGTNTKMGTPVNPWDMDEARVPGGSSSGSAVAVAAGYVPVALGSDTGGSVRIPASMCGTVGLKTSAGTISNHGILPLSRTLDTIGPLARSVEDAALMLAALRDPGRTEPVRKGVRSADPVAEMKSGVAGMRIGVLSDDDCEGIDLEVMAAYREACRTFNRLGARIEKVRLPAAFPDYLKQVGKIIAAEAYGVHKHWIEDEGLPFDEDVRIRVLAGKSITPAEYDLACDLRQAAQQEFNATIKGIAALLTPTTPVAAIPVSEVDQRSLIMSRFTRAVNYLDLCALAVPCGFTQAGLPVSLQIICRKYDEQGALRISWAFENETAWTARTPSLTPAIPGK